MEDLLRVGVVTSPHGVRGEVNVFPTTDEPERFPCWESLILMKKGEQSEVKPVSVKYFKQMVILKLAGVDSREQAEGLRQAELYIHRSQAAPCGENENFIADLIGLAVIDEEGRQIGICTDVLQTGANDVYVITLPEGKEALFPAIPQCILRVDLNAGKMFVHVMDGLMD